MMSEWRKTIDIISYLVHYAGEHKPVKSYFIILVDLDLQLFEFLHSRIIRFKCFVYVSFNLVCVVGHELLKMKLVCLVASDVTKSQESSQQF